MTISLIEGEPLRAIINPDFPDARAKRVGVAAVDLFTAGTSTAEDLSPHNFEPIEKTLCPGTNPVMFRTFMQAAGIEVK